MDALLDLMPPFYLGLAMLVAFFAGLVKGVVGFAMPMICVSLIGSFSSPQLAIAGMILPTLTTNLMQATGQGLSGARAAVMRFRWFLIAGGLCLLAAAQLVPAIPPRVYFLGLGIPVCIYVVITLAGFAFAQTRQRRTLDVGVGLIAGFFGGVAGIWGPPTVAYLTALNTPKMMQMQVQGVIYLTGTVVLVFAHAVSGVLNAQTVLFSALLVPSAVLGMVLGTWSQTYIDQTMFRRATLLVLLVAGANLVRRGIGS